MKPDEIQNYRNHHGVVYDFMNAKFFCGTLTGYKYTRFEVQLKDCANGCGVTSWVDVEKPGYICSDCYGKLQNEAERRLAGFEL